MRAYANGDLYISKVTHGYLWMIVINNDGRHKYYTCLASPYSIPFGANLHQLKEDSFREEAHQFVGNMCDIAKRVLT